MKSIKSILGVTLATLVLLASVLAVAQRPFPDDDPAVGAAEGPNEPINSESQEATAETKQTATEEVSKATNLDSISNSLKQPLTLALAERGTLTGLKGVCVKVVLNSPAPVFHLTQQALQSDIEMRLRSYGIKVLPEDIYQTDRDTALLQVKVEWKTIESLSVVYTTCRTYILQIAVLPRNEKLLCTYAITWDAISGTVVRLENLDAVYNNVHETLDDFIKDYLSANQKELRVGEDLKPLEDQ